MAKTVQSTHVEFRAVEVTLGSARMTMQIGGNGPALVLFHSLLADSSSFDRIRDSLAATHQVIALNLPGFGESDFVAGGIEAVADRVAEALKALDLPQKKQIFIGNGYGGFVALLTAIRHPALAARLVLADCGAAFSEVGRAAFRGMSAAVEKGGMAAVAEVAMRRLFAPEFQTLHPALIAERRQRFLAISPRTFHAACGALATLNLHSQLPLVKVPVLVLVGEMDEATPPPMSRELAAGLTNAQLIVLTGCAHVPQLQSPESFLSAIGSFLSD